MRVRVHIRDGHTCYRLQKRAQVAELIAQGPTDASKQPVDAEVGQWDATTNDYVFNPVRLLYLSKGAIGCIEVDEPAMEVAA